MSVITDILTRARDSLADPLEQRWSNDRLLRLLDEGQKDFARHTEILKGFSTITLVPGTQLYTLPKECWRVTRAHYASINLPLYSFEHMDSVDMSWYTRKSAKPTAIVFDKRNEQEIRVYPIPDGSFSDIKYNFSNETNPVYIGPALGVVTAIDDLTFNSPYGVVTDLFTIDVDETWFSSPYGVVTDIGEVDGNLTLFYIRDPADITSFNQELEIASRWHFALQQYVVGRAFMDDLDTQYQQRGATALQMYDRELKLAKSSTSMDATRATQYSTTYNGGI